MNRVCSIFSQILQLFSRLEFEGAVRKHKAEQSLIENLQAFLLELGKGFAFVARQQRISTD